MKGIFTLFVFLMMMIMLSSCDEGPTPNEKTKAILVSHSWKQGSTKIDNVLSDIYTGLSVSFKDKTFTAANGNPVWPSSGGWEFSDNSGTAITRSDDLQITIQEISDSQLVLSFNWTQTTFGQGRLRSIAGVHVMTFTK